eukprot:3484712-Rhodomonas_salina.1
MKDGWTRPHVRGAGSRHTLPSTTHAVFALSQHSPPPHTLASSWQENGEEERAETCGKEERAER